MVDIPEHLLLRSAEARAAASGKSVDEVLSSWAGGESIESTAPVEETPVEETPVEETPDEALQDNLEVNLLGTLRCTRAVIPGMRKQQWGRIINIGSVVGKRGWAFHGAYAASKFALTGLTQSLQAELANSGITATLVMPASTKTNFFSSATIVSDSYQPTMLGPVQSAEVVAKYIIKSAKQPKENVYTIWWMKWSFILAEMVPWLYSTASKQFFRRKNKQNQVK